MKFIKVRWKEIQINDASEHSVAHSAAWKRSRWAIKALKSRTSSSVNSVVQLDMNLNCSFRSFRLIITGSDSSMMQHHAWSSNYSNKVNFITIGKLWVSASQAVLIISDGSNHRHRKPISTTCIHNLLNSIGFFAAHFNFFFFLFIFRLKSARKSAMRIMQKKNRNISPAISDRNHFWSDLVNNFSIVYKPLSTGLARCASIMKFKTNSRPWTAFASWIRVYGLLLFSHSWHHMRWWSRQLI